MEMIQKVKENKFILKMVVLGDVGVGKSNIIRRIMNQNFQELEATVGVEFTYVDVADVDPNDPSKVLSIQIWDTCNYNINNILIIFLKYSRSRKISSNNNKSYKKCRWSIFSL